MQSRLFATSFSLLCFAAAVFSGVAVGNPSATVLGRGLVVLGLAYAVGRVLEGVASIADWSPKGLDSQPATPEGVSGNSEDPHESKAGSHSFAQSSRDALRKAA